MPVAQRGSSWQASVSHKGRRYRKDFPTKAEALAWEAETKAILLTGGTPDEGRGKAGTGKPLTMTELKDMVYQSVWKGSRAEHTTMVNANIVVFTIGPDVPITKVDTRTIDAAIQAWQRQGNSGATINRKLAALGKMLRWAHQRTYIPAVPHIERRKESEHRLRWFTEKEEAEMLAYFQHTGQGEMADLCAVALDTGMRQGELLALDTHEVFDAWVRLDGQKTKSGRSRDIPLTKRARSILARRKTASTDGKLFTLTADQVRHKWDAMCAHIGLEDDPQAVFHVCRHTFGSRLVQRGVPILEVQKLMGHETLQMTLRYAKLAPKNLAQAIAVLDMPVAAE